VCFHMISSYSEIICNLVRMCAHTTKLGWMLDYSIVGLLAKFQIQILTSGRITMQYVKMLNYHFWLVTPKFLAPWRLSLFHHKGSEIITPTSGFFPHLQLSPKYT
jgi:hypothetical protein